MCVQTVLLCLCFSVSVLSFVINKDVKRDENETEPYNIVQEHIQVNKTNNTIDNVELNKYKATCAQNQIVNADVLSKDLDIETAVSARKKQKDMWSKIMPMFIIPFLVQSAMLPMILMSMKMMLAKSFLVGKLALILIAINSLRHIDSNEGSGHEHELIQKHYGYNGNEEYGAYMN